MNDVFEVLKRKMYEKFYQLFQCHCQTDYVHISKNVYGKEDFFIIKHKKVTCAKLFSIFDIVSNKILEVKKPCRFLY